MHLGLWNAHHIIRHPVRLLLIFAVILTNVRLGLYFIGLQDFAHGGLLCTLHMPPRMVDIVMRPTHRRRRSLLVCCKGFHLLTL